MKKLILFLLAIFGLLGLSSCEDTGVDETKATIMAEDFAREVLISSKAAEFDNVGAEKTSENHYHVVFDVQTQNHMGLFVPRKISVRLYYKGEGDWTDKENWKVEKIGILDEGTGKVDNVIG